MKKIFILLLCIGSVILPSIVKADMGAPELISYEVIVTNKNGAKDSDSDTVIPYDTVCTVNFETDWQGYLELTAECKGFSGTYTLRGEDVRILSDEYQPTSDDKLDSPVRFYIYKDIEMYSGPSYKYEQIGETIPAGQIVTVTYADYEEVWGYTEYNGKKGWIYIYWYDKGNKIARVIENDDEKKLITVRDIDRLYKYPNDSLVDSDGNRPDVDVIEVSIPAGTALTAEYHYPILKDNGLFYVEYNGVKGWIDSYEGVAVRSKGSVLALSPNDIKIYDEKYKSTSIDISRYQDFSYEYRATLYENYKEVFIYAITYNNKNYFFEIRFNSEDDEFENDILMEADPYKVEVMSNAPIYETYEGKKEIGTISKGAIMDREYSRYISARSDVMYYIRTSELSGWVEGKYIVTTAYDEGTEMASIISNPFTNTSLTTTQSDEDKTSNTTDKLGMSTKEIVIMCVIGAIVLALVVGVIIVLVNRKKKMQSA